MKSATLIRTSTGNQGTVGEFSIDGKTFKSLELPWRGNQPQISCIPTGTYTCRMRYSNRFKRSLYEVLRVQDREAILIHPANFAGDKSKGFKTELQGCIALGLSIAQTPQTMLCNSREAVKQFMDIAKGEDFILTIK